MRHSNSKNRSRLYTAWRSRFRLQHPNRNPKTGGPKGTGGHSRSRKEHVRAVGTPIMCVSLPGYVGAAWNCSKLNEIIDVGARALGAGRDRTKMHRSLLLLSLVVSS